MTTSRSSSPIPCPVSETRMLFSFSPGARERSMRPPAGGRIDLSLAPGENENSIRVSDTGQGIGEDERDVVMRRFYRSDKSRNTHGAGLGLSLVSAIIKLHGFRLTLNTGAGCVAEIACPAPSN